MENDNIPMDNIDNSKPSKGREVRTAALNPNIDNRPIPQAAHPGAKAARKIPIDPNTPAFLFFDTLPALDLYKTKLNKIPKRTLIIIKLIKECILITLKNPKDNIKKNLNV